MNDFLLDSKSIPCVLPLQIINQGHAWNDNLVDIVIPWHLSLELLLETSRFHSKFANVVYLVPNGFHDSCYTSQFRVYCRGSQHPESSFMSYLKMTRRVAFLLWGDELIWNSSAILLNSTNFQNTNSNYVFQAKKTDVVCGCPLKPFLESTRGGSFSSLFYDSSDLHNQIKPASKSGIVIVDINLFHFSAVGITGAVKTSSNALNEFNLRNGFTTAFFLKRFVKSELFNIFLLPARAPFHLIPLLLLIKLVSFSSALFLVVYSFYSKLDSVDEPFRLYQAYQEKLRRFF